MTFLTPLGALVALAALVPLGAAIHGRIRVAAAARQLGLNPVRRWSLGPTASTAAAAVALLGLAAAQPALTDAPLVRTRTDVAALFVLDTSRSMAASLTPSSPTRLARCLPASTKGRSTASSSSPSLAGRTATIAGRASSGIRVRGT